MKKLVILLFLGFTMSTFSQNNDANFWDNVRFGGGFSLGFGTSTTIAVSPSAIYDFDNGFSLGTGISYLYNKFDGTTSNVFGGSIISLYNIPVINIQLSGEFEQLFVNQKNSTIKVNYNYPALYLGAAYQTGRLSFGLRYDVLYDKNKSIYASAISPIIRFYF